MITCDLNCDMGEGIGNDAAIIPFISSANIACGYHAGDYETMKETIQLAQKHSVAIGAHPSFLDRENFGRTEIKTTTAKEVFELIIEQLRIFYEVAVECGATINHVKPHGALYNMAARDASLAIAIAEAVKAFDPTLILYGLSGSYSISQAKAVGLATASEVFADRTYQNNGTLTPRSETNALIKNETTAIEQVLSMVKTGTVTSIAGKKIDIQADTICLHGDGQNAAAFAKAIHEKLHAENITIKPITNS